MHFITYFLASLISFLGLVVGIILVLLAPEEQKPGTKYFIFLQNLLFISAIALFLFFSGVNALFVFLAVVLFVAGVFKIKTKNYFKKTEIMYAVLAFVFFLSLMHINLFIIESVLIFLFGMPSGSLLFQRRKKNYYRVVFGNMAFLLIALSLFLVSVFA
jgi:hypothetical protein